MSDQKPLLLIMAGPYEVVATAYGQVTVSPPVPSEFLLPPMRMSYSTALILGAALLRAAGAAEYGKLGLGLVDEPPLLEGMPEKEST